MKKLNYLLLGAAGLMLASCAQEDLVGNTGNGDGTANVTLNLNTPKFNTRAVSDGSTAQKLLYAVYEVKTENGETKYNLIDEEGYYSGKNEDDAEKIEMKKTMTIKLLKDREYKVAFWAESLDNADGTPTNPYYVDFEADGGPVFTIDYNGPEYAIDKTSSEELDAFYATVDLKVSGDVQLDVDLKRPFAQINVGTNDLEAAKKLGYKVETLKSYMVADTYTKMTLFDGNVSGNISTHSNLANVIPATNENFPVDGYDYLAYTYVLTDDEGMVMNVEFGYQSEDDGTFLSRKVGSVPVKRNHRTNIYGQVLTANNDLMVEIKPAFDDPDLEPNALEVAAALGGTAVLDEDITLAKDKSITFTKDAVIDMNGHTLSGDKEGLLILDGANVTIKGNGTFKMNTTRDVDFLVVVQNGGTLTIENGTFVGQDDEVVVVYDTGGSIYIKGGTFTRPDNGDYGALVRCYAAGYDSGKSNIYITGGTFYNWNPDGYKLSGVPHIYVHDGYKSVESEGENGTKLYTVMAEDTKVITPSDNIADAFKNIKDGDVLFIDGDCSATSLTTSFPQGVSFTVKGVSADLSEILFDYASAKDCEITFENITIRPVYNPTNHTASGLKGIKKATFNNVNLACEFAIYSGEVTFNDCQFTFNKSTDGQKKGRYGAYIYGGDITFNNCLFDQLSNDQSKSKAILVYPFGAGADSTEMGDVNVNNCNFIGGKIANDSNAAVEIHSEKVSDASQVGTITINNSTYDEEAYPGKLWREVNGAKQFFKVVVDGVTVQEKEQ
ncbi:MAG: hypothetical protein J1F43_07955 [Muribaculaceae bacterium]|nr:hypothetical protein [Muribaculaceae bacterium]